MAAPDALSIPGDSTAPEAAVVPEAGVASRRPQLIPIAQLIAVVLGVAGIIWHQQQTTDNLRTELRDEIAGVEASLRAEINGVETGLGAEITSLRAEVAENGQRLARIEGFLGIGVPDVSPPSSP
jgi:uncharacterized protein HemX